MVRKSLVMSMAVVAVVLPVGAASATAAVGFFTPTVPVHTASGSSPCFTVTQGGASYDPRTGAWTVKPVTVQFSSVSNCI